MGLRSEGAEPVRWLFLLSAARSVMISSSSPLPFDAVVCPFIALSSPKAKGLLHLSEGVPIPRAGECSPGKRSQRCPTSPNPNGVPYLRIVGDERPVQRCGTPLGFGHSDWRVILGFQGRRCAPTLRCDSKARWALGGCDGLSVHTNQPPCAALSAWIG